MGRPRRRQQSDHYMVIQLRARPGSTPISTASSFLQPIKCCAQLLKGRCSSYRAVYSVGTEGIPRHTTVMLAEMQSLFADFAVRQDLDPPALAFGAATPRLPMCSTCLSSHALQRLCHRGWPRLQGRNEERNTRSEIRRRSCATTALVSNGATSFASERSATL